MRSCIQTLSDGTRVLIRPVMPSDREGLRRGVREMSRTSRHMRFFQGMNEISESMLDYFTRVDQQSHVAWCGVDPVGAVRGYGIGRFRINEISKVASSSSATPQNIVKDFSSQNQRAEASLDQLPIAADKPQVMSARTADFAVAVIDDMQAKGLGTLLMAVIYLQARERGVQELCGEILPENPVMPQWIVRLGGRLDWDDRQKQYIAHWPVVPVDQLPADSSTASRFLQWIDKLEQAESGG